MSLKAIETATREFSDARQALMDKMQALQDEIERVKRAHLVEIRALAGAMAVAHEVLFEEIRGNKDLFEKPKTRTISGIRVGLKKKIGRVVVDDEAVTIDLIRKVLSKKEAELLIRKEEHPVIKGGLDQLPADILKRLAVKVESDTDEVFIKPVGDDIDKLVAALLEEGEKLLREVA